VTQTGERWYRLHTELLGTKAVTLQRSICLHKSLYWPQTCRQPFELLPKWLISDVAMYRLCSQQQPVAPRAFFFSLYLEPW